YGRQEKLFNSIQERKVLTDYTKKAIEFAEAVGCNNLVFGCPRNRVIKEEADKENAILFFREIGDYASEHHTVVAIEANPPIYNTNYINDTESALDLIGQVDSKGFLLNLDVGTMIENNEEISVLHGKEHLINHVHISEPNLKRIEERDVHGKLASFLTGCDYGGYVSIEVGRQDDVSSLEEMMLYVRRIFGEQL
ncbi:MAG: sugar phosphate isomerase/epimerase, partial [Lachnospiraceae bacterium]|nr:sugar phosphate isomerase/epimerase [Lachnospiraceae bacterium]